MFSVLGGPEICLHFVYDGIAPVASSFSTGRPSRMLQRASADAEAVGPCTFLAWPRPVRSQSQIVPTRLCFVTIKSGNLYRHEERCMEMHRESCSVRSQFVCFKMNVIFWAFTPFNVKLIITIVTVPKWNNYTCTHQQGQKGAFTFLNNCISDGDVQGGPTRMTLFINSRDDSELHMTKSL